MAVQAQYPSNVLLLNRSGQDRNNMHGEDYSLLAQTSSFIDQPTMFFTNGGMNNNNNTNNNNINTRKRGREVAIPSAAPINLFSLQSQNSNPTLVNLAQLHNQQGCVVSTGLRLSFEDQQQQKQQQQQAEIPNSGSPFLPSFLTEELAAQIKQQRDEIDQFLQAQGERLRRTIAERRQRHYHALLCAAEESAVRRLREKEGEVEKAARRHAELEERAAQLKAETLAWQGRARAQEATAASLQTQLQHAMTAGRVVAQDNREELGCAAGETAAEDAESAYVDPDRVVALAGPVCKACRRRIVSVVLLPCRHLCVCTECDAVVEACPMCQSVRSASVQVFLS